EDPLRITTGCPAANAFRRASSPTRFNAARSCSSVNSKSSFLEFSIFLIICKASNMVILRSAHAQRRLFKRYHRVRIDALCQPNVGADHRVMADHGVAAQDGGVGVNHHFIFQGGMAFHAADDVAGSITREAQSAQSDALIQLHVLADVAGLANDDAGAVIDEE